MKTLSLRQPWASLIFAGKNVENRSWSTNYRGRIAIHASLAAAPPEHREKAKHLADMGYASRLDLADLPRGAVLGTVELVGVESGYESPWATEAPFQWLLANPELFEQPVPATGRLGLWEWRQ